MPAERSHRGALRLRSLRRLPSLRSLPSLPSLRGRARGLAATALIATSLATALPAVADDAPPSPLQARLDALQRIEVTEARATGADAAAASPEVQAALDEAEAAERADPDEAHPGPQAAD